MRTRLIFFAAQFWLLAQAPMLPAAPLRVTTWDLQPGAAAGTNGWSIQVQQSLVQEAADSLKKLRPDVILLQHVAGWQTCQQLAQALQPEVYQVAACSSWGDPLASNAARQVAILSKARAGLAWSEPWRNSAGSPVVPGGFAFAALRSGDKTIGVFSVQSGGGITAQLIRQIASLQNWQTNRPQACVVAGDFNLTPDGLRLARGKAVSRLEQLGFADALAGLPLDKRAAPECMLIRDAGLVSPPLITQTAHAEHGAVTCEMDPAAPAAATLANATAPGGGSKTLWCLAGFLAGGLALFVVVRKIARRSALQPATALVLDSKANSGAEMANLQAAQIIAAPPSESAPPIEMEISAATPSPTWQSRPAAVGETARMPEKVRTGLVANLSQWLKQKVVRRLVSDRAQLLATQQAATLKIMAVDKRLSKVEEQIQERNQDYERRIDELLKALINAEAENRELIRAQIASLKAEMERARLKARQQGKEYPQY